MGGEQLEVISVTCDKYILISEGNDCIWVYSKHVPKGMFGGGGFIFSNSDNRFDIKQFVGCFWKVKWNANVNVW